MSIRAVRWCLFLLPLCLCACFERESLAPVVESHWRAYNSKVSQHVVVRGETLYAIAFRYDEDYRQLATLNHLQPPYTVRVGQVVRLHNIRRQATPNPPQRWTSHRPVAIRPLPLQRPVGRQYAHWLWPAKGRVVASFVPTQGKKGIDIAGHKGEHIYASSGGVVAYAGSGLSGYGNLIIIRHDNQYLTAYGNNARNLVSEGQFIKAGQVIAEMGVVDRHFYGLHFEIRQAGQPVNPMNYLGTQ